MALSQKNKAYIALAATSLIWGTTWVAMKFGLKGLPPLELASIRQFIAGSIFIVFFLFKKEALPTVQQFKKLFFLAILTFVLANAVSTWSLKYISSGLGALIGALYPLSVVIIEYFFFKNKSINYLTIIGILLGIGGIVFVFYDNAFGAHPQGYIFGIVLAIIAMLAWSLSSILISRKYIQMNPYFGMGWQMLISSIIVGIFSISSEDIISISEISLTSWLAITYLIIAGSIVAIIAFIYSLKYLNPAIAVLYAYINPIIAMITGAILLNEKLTAVIFIGSLITLIGVFLVNFSMKKIKEKEILG
ncbi:MAG: EamA family transporter [Chitinophagaceae bacterium]|nr:EamA family transporter [Chitinophagaceae bacterium]